MTGIADETDISDLTANPGSILRDIAPSVDLSKGPVERRALRLPCF